MPKIAFNTANLVAQVTGWRFKLNDWGDQHDKTVAITDRAHWQSICTDVAKAGYTAMEVWQAHADPKTMTAARAKEWKQIAADHGLSFIGYAGAMGAKQVEICQWLGIDTINGGLHGTPVAEAESLSRASGVRFNYENHPEKTAAEILQKINGGSANLGICIDTGWLGTQNLDAPQTFATLGPLVRHVHIKDVSKAGTHATCLLGTGVVDLTGSIKVLKSRGYAGWYSWEDEPEERNPMLSAAENREWIERALAGK